MTSARPTDRLPHLASFTAPTATDPVRFAVIADPHVSESATGTTKVYHRSEARLAAALEDAAARGAETILSLGDLTKDGHPDEFAAVDRILDEAPLEVTAIPGNHDVPKAVDDHDSPSATTFARTYGDGDYPVELDIGEVTVFGLNTATASDGSLCETAGGAIDPATIEWLDDRLGRASAPIIATHHNTPGIVSVLEDYYDATEAPVGPPSSEEWDFFLQDPAPLRDTLEAHDVSLVLTGHLHIPAVGQWGSITEVTAPATGSYPQSYLLVDVDASGTTIRYVPIADRQGMWEAYTARDAGSDFAQWLTGIAATHLASMPLAVEDADRTCPTRE